MIRFARILKTAVALFLLFYAAAWVKAFTKPSKLVEGSIAYVDFDQGRLSIQTQPGYGVLCAFDSDQKPAISGLKRGDNVSVQLGYSPEPLFPWCSSYTVRSVAKL